MSAQPETCAMMNQIERGGFSLSVTLDGGSLLTTYPYDRPTEPGDQFIVISFRINVLFNLHCLCCISLAHNEETLRYLASIYASHHPVMHLGYPGCVNGLGMKYLKKYAPS